MLPAAMPITLFAPESPVIRFTLLTSFSLLVVGRPVKAQRPDSSLLTVQRIYGSSEFKSQSFGPARWLGTEGSAYTTLEEADEQGGQNLVRYDTERGGRQVLVAARQLIPPGDSVPLQVEEYAWSPDNKMLLIFTNTRPVWRLNTRGDYWVLELASGRLHQLGGKDAKPSTLMFAKLSPDGRRVGYVRENNLYVEDLATGRVTALTTNGSTTLINGTSDWVNEEEFFLRDCWRWSPDSRSIAFWQFDASGIETFYLLNNTDSLYPKLTAIPYPKAGTTNAAVRVGVVSADGGEIRWMKT